MSVPTTSPATAALVPAQTTGIPVRRPMPTARAQMLPAQVAPQQQQSALPGYGYRSLGDWRNSFLGRLKNVNRAGIRLMTGQQPAFKKGGNVEKVNKLKKPTKKKSLKKADRVKKPAFKEGGAVERFLQKYPDYNPEG